MNEPTIVAPDTSLPAEPASAATATHSLYWSVRRELWENRSIYLVPLIVAAFVLFAALISLIGLPRRVRHVPPNDPVKQHAVMVAPYSVASAPIMVVAFLVGIFYSLDALHGERRDRSILFWKSLPVSDRTTVLSKAAIPLVVLPAISFVLGLTTQLVLMPATSAVLLAHGVSPATLWSEFRFVQEPLVMIYGLLVHALWFAPLFAWLLLVSAWARRTPILWAALPPFAILLLERIAFHSNRFALLLKYRMTGAMDEAFALTPTQDTGVIDRLTQLDPIRFVTAPGLWLGLLFAAGCLAAAVRLRRNREPI